MSVQIRKGSDKVVFIRLVSEESGEPYDLAAATEITVRLAKDDGTALLKKLSEQDIVMVGNAALGKFKVLLSDTDTLLLKADDAASVEVLVEFGDDEVGVQLPGVLTVREPIVP